MMLFLLRVLWLIERKRPRQEGWRWKAYLLCFAGGLVETRAKQTTEE